LSRLNFRPRASYGVVTSAGLVLESMAYAVTYSAALVILAIIIFKRRDFK
jgi:hypothetical protein